MASSIFLRLALIAAPHVLLVELLLGSVVVGLTPPNSVYRIAGLPLVSACTWNIMKFASQQMRPRRASLLGGSSFLILLRYLDVALLRRWSFNAHASDSEYTQRKGIPHDQVDIETAAAVRTTSQLESTEVFEQHKHKSFQSLIDSAWQRFKFEWNSIMEFRQVNSLYQVRGVQPFSTIQPDCVPSRWLFVIQRTTMAATSYLVLDRFSSRRAPPNNGEIFNRALIPFFRRLNTSISVAGFGVTFYFLIQGFYSAVSAIVVGLGLSDVKEWPPAFGSISEGKTWHQFLRRSITSVACYLHYDILRLPRDSLIGQHFMILSSFALSAVMYSAAGVASGMSIKEPGVVQFFCTQALDILLEQALVNWYRSWKGSIKSAKPPSLLIRVAGYTWLCAYMTWSGLVWLYPQAGRTEPGGTSGFVPFSIVKALRS